MRIDSIHVSDFLGLHAVDLRDLAPVSLFCGSNGAGKSSLKDAVALALTADLGRVSLKKDAGQLVRTGAQAAVCRVVDADGDEHQVIIKAGGQITDSHKGRDVDPALAFAFDGQRFARLEADQRRSFLFSLMSVKTDAKEVTARLLARRLDKARVERIVPLLRSGFDAAETEAKRKVTEARGAWKAVTGEAYGSEKAKGWKAAVPAYDAGELKRLGTEVEHADVAIWSWQQQVGKLQAEEQRRQSLRAKLPALAEHAARIKQIQAKAAVDEQNLQQAEQDLERAVAAAGAGPRVGLVHDLAHALRDTLFFVGNDHQFRAAWAAPLAAYEAEHGPIEAATTGNPEAQARMPALRKAAGLMASAVAHNLRDLAAAQALKAEHERITAELAEAFDAAALAEAREQIEALQTQRAAAVKGLDALRRVKALAEAAEDKTKRAAEHAGDVLAWDALAEQLSPGGIPGDLLREALGPIQERLAQHAADTGWPQVRIHDDMRITAGERDFRLLSESEQWRACAMLAEAIVYLSGCRLLVLDRMDVLDLRGRGELLGWLDTLADLGEIDTALVFATLKAQPTQLPAHCAAHWIDSGLCAPQLLKEAA